MIHRSENRLLVRSVCACLLFGIVGMSGCSQQGGRPKVYPVSGSVKYKGATMADLAITFYPEGKSPRNPNAVTDSQGNFKLTTYDTNDGAVAGDYVVTIAPSKSATGKKPSEMTAQDLINLGPGGAISNDKTIPEKYADPKTSGLKRSVVAGETNTFNFDLTE